MEIVGQEQQGEKKANQGPLSKPVSPWAYMALRRNYGQFWIINQNMSLLACWQLA